MFLPAASSPVEELIAWKRKNRNVFTICCVTEWRSGQNTFFCVLATVRGEKWTQIPYLKFGWLTACCQPMWKILNVKLVTGMCWLYLCGQHTKLLIFVHFLFFSQGRKWSHIIVFNAENLTELLFKKKHNPNPSQTTIALPKHSVKVKTRDKK